MASEPQPALRWRLGLLALYALVVFLMLDWRPLWVDELHQLRGTRGTTWAECIRWVASGPGGAPLAYLAQKLTMDWFGFSTWVARLSAALASIASLPVFYSIARRLVPRHALLGTILFAIMPVQYRYAAEARPYAPALLISLVTLWAFLRLVERPSALLWATYGLSTVAGLYTQPFTIFPVLGQCAWAWWSDRRLALRITAALAAATLVFLPWMAHVRAVNAEVGTMQQYFFAWSQVSPLMIVRELVGGSYWATLPLLILAALGVRSTARQPHLRWPLVAMLTAGLVGPILADAAGRYFFASRQLLFALPALLLLALAGLAALERRGRHMAAVLLAVFCVASVVKDYRYARTATEDWQAAAAGVLAAVRDGGCVVPVPEENFVYYLFYEPSLRERRCVGTPPQGTIYVISPYATQAERAAVPAGSGQLVGGTEIRANSP